jgi:hypothetical protein
MAQNNNDFLTDNIETTTAALRHYQIALGLFAHHLTVPEGQFWITFPALWLLIRHEQAYGDDPRDFKAHLRGVRDIIDNHGRQIFDRPMDGSNYSPSLGCVPPQILDRIALWTIHYDAKASTFALDGGIIDLINRKYPGGVEGILDNAKGALKAAWGAMYPTSEEVWDMKTEQFWSLDHEIHMARYKLSKFENQTAALTPGDLLGFGREVKQLEKKFAHLVPLALSKPIEEGSSVAYICTGVANLFALVARYDRLAYEIQSPAVPLLLQVCAKLHGYEPGFLWHIAWPLFVAVFETDDVIYQNWILDRFRELEKSGKNIQRARALLEAMVAKQRTIQTQTRYADWICDDRFEKFSL